MEHDLQTLPDRQLSLLPESTTDKMLEDKEYSQGIYSGVQLKKSAPDRYMEVCAMLADGSISQRQISRLTGISRNLVSAINRQSSDIEPLKQKLAGRHRNIAELCSERIEELLRDPAAKVTLKDLIVAAGIGTEKFLLLSGEATQRVETIDSSSGADDFEAQFRALQHADVEELPAMGCAAVKEGTKGAGLVADAAQPGADRAGVDEEPAAVSVACETSEDSGK